MYINKVGHYIPRRIIDNKYFEDLHGFDTNWITKRTGIIERRRAENEDVTTMAVNAAENASKDLPYDVKETDLIIAATYSPKDTVNTLAHYVQHKMNIENAMALTVSSACSSFINALEIAEGYIATGKAKKILIVASEHNTAYSNDNDPSCGHLWGDGAAAFFISSERLTTEDTEIKAIKTKGLGTVGKSQEGVKLEPAGKGITMPNGKDVFTWACVYMADIVKEITKENNISLSEINYVIPHQANVRIIENVRKQLKLAKENIITNIEYLGNTGCASVAIAFSQNIHKYKSGDKIILTVFGGGYSCGAALLEK